MRRNHKTDKTSVSRYLAIILAGLLVIASFAGCAESEIEMVKPVVPEISEEDSGSGSDTGSDGSDDYSYIHNSEGVRLPESASAYSNGEDAEPDPVITADYPEYSGHPYVSSRDYGTSGRLAGRIYMILVFVNDSDSRWSEEDIANFFDAVYSDADYLHDQASDWGTDLEFVYGYFKVDVPAEQEERWYEYLMESFFNRTDHQLDGLQEYYEGTQDAGDAPLLFIFNKEGRSYTYQGSRHNKYTDEYSVFYAKSMMPNLSITHELLHLYGANDFYFPESVKKAAETYLPGCSMLYGNREVDDFTAFMIGWTDELTQDAIGFLDDTSNVTFDMIDNSLQDEWDKWS